MTTLNLTLKPTHSRTVRYRLLHMKMNDGEWVYYVQVRFGKEQSIRRLPCQNRKRAFELYQMIRRGKVTPCTLDDILEDMK